MSVCSGMLHEWSFVYYNRHSFHPCEILCSRPALPYILLVHRNVDFKWNPTPRQGLSSVNKHFGSPTECWAPIQRRRLFVHNTPHLFALKLTFTYSYTYNEVFGWIWSVSLVKYLSLANITWYKPTNIMTIVLYCGNTTVCQCTVSSVSYHITSYCGSIHKLREPWIGPYRHLSIIAD